MKEPEVHQIPQVPHSQQAEEAAFQLYTNKPLAIPASFIQASTCAWTFPVKATRHRTSVVLSHTCGTQTFATHVISSTSNTTSSLPIFPETSGGTVCYCTSPNLATPLTSSLTTSFHSVSPIHPDTLCSLTVSTVNTHQPQASVSSEKIFFPSGNWPNTMVTISDGMNCLAILWVPSNRQHSRMMSISLTSRHYLHFNARTSTSVFAFFWFLP